MTWGKASLVLVSAFLFDALRFIFVMFWFFGPIIAGLSCAAKVGDIWLVGGLLASGCAAGTIAIGVAGAPAITAFGVIMAMAVGLAGWLTIGLILIISNRRIFKENALWFAGSLLFSEIPIIGAIPAITITVWKMYNNQIKLEKAVYKKWEREAATIQAQERKRIAEIQISLAQQEAANDEKYAQAQAANDEQYTQKLDNAA